jgi:hypothetical protein
MVPFHSYAGTNSGIPIDALTTDAFRSGADELFGFNGTERLATTPPGWINPIRLPDLRAFCDQVVSAYAEAMIDERST